MFPPIIGIPLDGTHDTQPVVDSDKGLLDADPVWDRAVGAMQFTPGTWQRWASDGNGDGKLDPQNLYDATLGAARKLCSDAGAAGLHTDPQLAAALEAVRGHERAGEGQARPGALVRAAGPAGAGPVRRPRDPAGLTPSTGAVRR